MVKNLDQLIEQLFSGFNAKQRKVLTDRFGLRTGEQATLQAIGDSLGITRERVRQIEEQALKKLAVQVKVKVPTLVGEALSYLASVGGVRRDDCFVSDARHQWFGKGDLRHADQKVRFIFAAAGAPAYHREDDDVHAFWYTNDAAEKKFQDHVRQAVQFFNGRSRDALLKDQAYLAYCRDFTSGHFLSISKHFGMNVFGDIGLRAWREIVPKTIRDKAYLVLRKHGSPLHFEDIAKFINRYGIDRKPAHVQTVHNELIKDDHFILVGRGVYGLREQGFEPGTVREVIARVLRKRGPLASTDVVRFVGEQRVLKMNTVLLSLQNRRYFRRLNDGRYHVKEA